MLIPYSILWLRLEGILKIIRFHLSAYMLHWWPILAQWTIWYKSDLSRATTVCSHKTKQELAVVVLSHAFWCWYQVSIALGGTSDSSLCPCHGTSCSTELAFPRLFQEVYGWRDFFNMSPLLVRTYHASTHSNWSQTGFQFLLPQPAPGFEVQPLCMISGSYCTQSCPIKRRALAEVEEWFWQLSMPFPSVRHH